MNVYIFSSSINIFKILLKSSHDIESVLSFSIFLLHKSAIFNPLDLARHIVNQFVFLHFRVLIGPHMFLS